MSPRIATVMGVVTVAALGTWLKAKRRLRQAAPIPRRADLDGIDASMEIEQLHIEDDEAADIIRRAQPALERARQFISAQDASGAVRFSAAVGKRNYE